ncbi:MAG: MBL fold metallo-hydrolase [Anaerolineae bacterium]|nr:MBL fold metallo-hydrolase [Anaerolineae bacterium]
MLRERVANDIYVFTSDLYAQVTAGAIVTPEGIILIDSLPFPVETREMKDFLEQISSAGVRYILLTHYHADHAYGAYLFPQANVIAHRHYRQLATEVGIPALETARQEEPALEEVTIRMPDIVLDEGEMWLELGGKQVQMMPSPGHTPDSLMLYVPEDRVLFAADTVLPVPSIVDGDINTLRASLRKVLGLPIENLVQGHGEVVLRGEVQSVIQASLNYLDAIEEKAAKAARRRNREILLHNNIESCGLSRIPLNGLVQRIHVANLLYLYENLVASERT